MSFQAYTRAVRLVYVDGTHALTLLSLAEMANPHDDTCFAGDETVAFLAKVGERRVKKLVADLNDEAVLFSVRGNGRGYVTRYLITIGLTQEQIVRRLVNAFNAKPDEAKRFAAWNVERQRIRAAAFWQAQVEAQGRLLPYYLREMLDMHQLIRFTEDGQIIPYEGTDAPRPKITIPVVTSFRKGDQNGTLKKGDRNGTLKKGDRNSILSRQKGDRNGVEGGSNESERGIKSSQKGDRLSSFNQASTPSGRGESPTDPTMIHDHDPVYDPANHPTITHDDHEARHNGNSNDRLAGGEDVALVGLVVNGEEPLADTMGTRDRAFFIAGLRRVPCAPAGQPEVDTTGLELLTGLWQQWHDVKPTRAMFDDLITFAGRYDAASGGYGWYWVVRALQDASRVATVPGSVNYIEGILRRWATHHTWGQPYCANRQPELPSARRNGILHPGHSAGRSQVDTRLDRARARGRAQLGEDD